MVGEKSDDTIQAEDRVVISITLDPITAVYLKQTYSIHNKHYKNTRFRTR